MLKVLPSVDLRLSARFLIIIVISLYNSRILLTNSSLVVCRASSDYSIAIVLRFLRV